MKTQKTKKKTIIPIIIVSAALVLSLTACNITITNNKKDSSSSEMSVSSQNSKETQSSKSDQESKGNTESAKTDQTSKSNNDKADISYEITDTVFEHGKNSIGTHEYTGIVEITNNGKSNLYLKNCTFDLEDDNGHLLQTDDMISSCPDIIAPGEKGYFYNSYGSIDDGVSLDNGLKFKPNVEIVKAKGDPVDYEVSDLSIIDDTFGPKITGRIKNATDKDDSMIYVQVIFYDENNKVMAIEGTNVLDLKAGAQKSFDVSGIGLPENVKNGEYSKYEVLARATYYQFDFS